MYGDNITTDGYAIYTTIDSHLQEIANQSLRSGLLAYDQRHGYRGPESNLGTPNLKHMQEWEKTLGNIPVVGGLEPAVVVDMTNKSVTVLRSNGNLAVIPWDG